MLRYFGDGLAMPGRMVLDANLSTTLPRFAWATNRLGVTASGAGLAHDGLRRALGEYFERRHFYLEVRGDTRGTLAAVENESLRRAIQRALRQTARADALDTLDSHPFALSQAMAFPDFQPVTAPTVLFSVTGDSLGKDGDFLPCRDTVGCAAHFGLLQALHGALRELAERQYLLRYWLTGRGAQDVSDTVAHRLSPQARLLSEQLARSGDLHFLELSQGELAGAIVLAVYRGRGEGPVRYCVGLCCDSEPAPAADRALKELWQSHVFLCNMVKKADVDALVHDRYHRYFLNCNTRATADAMLCGLQSPLAPARPQPPGELIASIGARFTHLLCYIRQVAVVSRRLWCVRVVSPEAFLHMDNSRHFNLACAYSAPFRSEILPSRLSRMVPFP